MGCSPGSLVRLISNGLEILCLPAGRAEGQQRLLPPWWAPTPLLPFGDPLISAFWQLECDGACDGPISLIAKMGEASQTGMSPCSVF